MAKYYVTMTDSFMSGWGQAAGKTNKLVIECDSREEAEVVADNARSRSEMKYVNISNRRPNYASNKYFTSWTDKGDYANWFIPGYFKR